MLERVVVVGKQRRTRVARERRQIRSGLRQRRRLAREPMRQGVDRQILPRRRLRVRRLGRHRRLGVLEVLAPLRQWYRLLPNPRRPHPPSLLLVLDLSEPLVGGQGSCMCWCVFSCFLAISRSAYMPCSDDLWEGVDSFHLLYARLCPDYSLLYLPIFAFCCTCYMKTFATKP